MNKLDQLIDRFIPEIAAAFRAAIAEIKDRVLLDVLIAAIEAGDPVAAFRALGMTDSAFNSIVDVIERAFETGGIYTASTFPSRLNTPAGPTRMIFDIRDSRAERWIKEESSRLITNIQEDTRAGTINLLNEGIKDGRNPRSVALDLVGRKDKITGRRTGGIIGLTPRDEAAVARAKAELRSLDDAYFRREARNKQFDRLIARAIKDGKPLSEADITRIAGKYTDNLLLKRGERIGRTEAVAALNRSEYEALLQARDIGAINQSVTTREWDSAGDKRVRHTHRAMDGQQVALDQPFKSPTGALMMHPGDTTLDAPGSETIMCRCRVKLNVDWLADLD